MKVAVDAAPHVALEYGGEAFAAIVADREIKPGLVNTVGIVGVSDDPGKIEGAPLNVPSAAHLGPTLAGIIGAEKRRLLCFHHRVDTSVPGAGDRETNAAENPIRQTLANRVPSGSAIRALEKAAARSPGGEAVRRAPELPHAGVKYLRILRVQGQVGAPRVVVYKQGLRPGLAAVGGLEHATLRIRVPQVPAGANENGVAVLGVNDDAGNVLRIGQPHEVPVVAGVPGAVDAGTYRDAVAHPRFARADPDRLLVRGIDGYGTDRLRRLFVEDRLEGNPAIDGFPHAPACRADVDSKALVPDRVNGGDAPTHRGRANGAGLESAERVRVKKNVLREAVRRDLHKKNNRRCDRKPCVS